MGNLESFLRSDRQTEEYNEIIQDIKIIEQKMTKASENQILNIKYQKYLNNMIHNLENPDEINIEETIANTRNILNKIKNDPNLLKSIEKDVTELSIKVSFFLMNEENEKKRVMLMKLKKQEYELINQCLSIVNNYTKSQKVSATAILNALNNTILGSGSTNYYTKQTKQLRRVPNMNNVKNIIKNINVDNIDKSLFTTGSSAKAPIELPKELDMKPPSSERTLKQSIYQKTKSINQEDEKNLKSQNMSLDDFIGRTKQKQSSKSHSKMSGSGISSFTDLNTYSSSIPGRSMSDSDRRSEKSLRGTKQNQFSKLNSSMSRSAVNPFTDTPSQSTRHSGLKYNQPFQQKQQQIQQTYDDDYNEDEYDDQFESQTQSSQQKSKDSFRYEDDSSAYDSSDYGSEYSESLESNYDDEKRLKKLGSSLRASKQSIKQDLKNSEKLMQSRNNGIAFDGAKLLASPKYKMKPPKTDLNSIFKKRTDKKSLGSKKSK